MIPSLPQSSLLRMHAPNTMRCRHLISMSYDCAECKRRGSHGPVPDERFNQKEVKPCAAPASHTTTGKTNPAHSTAAASDGAAVVRPDPAPKQVLCRFIPCEIPTTTAQMKGVSVRNGKPFFFTNKKAAKAGRQIAAFLRPHAPPAPFTGPLSLTLELRFRWRKAESKRHIKQWEFYPIDTAPDVDNLAKEILDQMTKLGFWKSDGQLARLQLTKVWADTPGLDIMLTEETGTKRAYWITPP